MGVAFAASHEAAASAASVVWVQTNQPAGNSIVVYDRGSDGRLTRAGIYATAGDGGVAAPGTESDHLGSQGLLIYDAAAHLLFAVNAGSNSLSAFSVHGDRLQLESVVASGGQLFRGRQTPDQQREGANVIVEYIRYTVPADQADAFESAYACAGSLLEQDEHCLAFEVARGIEEPEHFIVRIEWDSLDGHEHGFRASPHFQQFFRDVQPYFSEIDEMKHYEIRGASTDER